MEEKNYYSALAFCQHHQIEIRFLHALQEYGLLEAEVNGDDLLLSPGQLDTVEKLVRLHYDLHINLEGIDAISHLLHRVESLQAELRRLQALLRLHEAQI